MRGSSPQGNQPRGARSVAVIAAELKFNSEVVSAPSGGATFQAVSNLLALREFLSYS